MLFVLLLALAVPSDDEAELRRASEAWMAAVAAKDAAALEMIVAREFALKMPGDTPAQYTLRDEWMANAIKLDWRDFRSENVVVELHGDHAVVSSKLSFRLGLMPFALDSGVVDTWVKRDGRWQVTGRFLGESQAQGRIKLAGGALAMLVLVLVVVAVRRMRRRLGWGKP
jgi:hypothetical protein